ncbi:MAG: hypothetical protein ACU0A5_06370 [Salipiger marinus]|uniref:hypothetical protein n=1 Tax=Salipiger marinus TaxID=555512 RepID=UPI004059341C
MADWTRLRTLTLALGLAVAASVAQAQDIPVLDVNFLPADLRPVRHDDCGVALGIDLRWPRDVARDREQDGDVRTTYSYMLGEHFHARDPRPGARHTTKPTLLVTLACSVTTGRSDGFLEGFATRLHAASEGRDNHWGPLTRVMLPGLGTAYLTYGERVGLSGVLKGSLSDRMGLFFLHRDQLVLLWVDVSRTPPANLRKTLPAGTVVRRSGRDGVFQLAHEARQKGGGPITYLRSAAENRALMEALKDSLRPL